MTASGLVLASIGALLVCIAFVRIPVALLLTALGYFGYASLDGFANAGIMLGNEFWSAFSGTGLTVVPFFVLMGQICFRSGLSSRLYASISAFTERGASGIAAATLLACGGFAAICGSNTATAATMSSVALPELRKYGCHPAFAAGLVAVGTTLGAVIPPSVVAVVLATQEPTLSVRSLFIGGIAPGLLWLGLFMLTVWHIGRTHPEWVPAGVKSGGRRMSALLGLTETFTLFALVVGGLSFGLFTPTEAGAAGSALALAMGFVSRLLSLRGFWLAVQESLRISAMIFLLLAGAGTYGKFLAISRTPFWVANFIHGLTVSPMAILLLIFLVFLLGGMFMDALALLLITLPIFFPVIKSMGVDPLWFGLMLLVVTTFGAITPPVGTSIFVVSAISRIPLPQVFRGAAYFFPAFFLCLLIMALLPDAVLFLPRLLAP